MNTERLAEPDFIETWTPYRLGRRAIFDGIEWSDRMTRREDRGELVRFAEMYAPMKSLHINNGGCERP
jgi:hypothetical protein